MNAGSENTTRFVTVPGRAGRMAVALFDVLTQIGAPIPLGSHSDVIEDFRDRLSALGLHPDVIEQLLDRRGEDCVPKWGSQICTNDPCPEDCTGQGRCADIARAFPHRLRAGASMRHDSQLACGGAA